MIFASLFSGFGLADIGAMQAGIELAWGIELDPQIADVSRQLGHTIYNESVTEIDFCKLEKPDILWASPECQRFSSANKKRGETPKDIELAKAVAKAIRTFEPKYFFLENVEDYKRSIVSLPLIENTLYELGYMCDRQIVDAANFGVPQNRRRLILRAIKGQFVPPLPLPVKWVGWYEAIADLIPGLPEVELAPWQVKAMEASDAPQFFKALLVPGGNISNPRKESQPSHSVVSSDGNIPKAILIEGAGARSDRNINLRTHLEPSWTLRSSIGANGTVKRLANAVVGEPCRTVALTPRALARFQTLPDWYELPSKTSLAVKGIGNGVPCLLAKTVIESCLATADYLRAC